MPKQKATILHAVRYDGLAIDQNVFVRVLHDEGLDLMSAIDACFTAWYKTEAGRAAWSASCCDYNIGDMLCGNAPDRDFTRQYGFEFLPDTGEDIIEMSYDRVLGTEPDEEDDETVGTLDLLRAYMRVNHPRGLFAVLDFYDSDSEVVTQQAINAFGNGADWTPAPGWNILPITPEFRAQLMLDFDKTGLDIWIFSDGELIDETR